MKKHKNIQFRYLEPLKKFCESLPIGRIIRFTLVGGAATLSYFLLGLLFVDFFEWPLLAGNASAYILSFIISYAGQSRWTFETRGHDKSCLPKFAMAQLLGLGLNSLIIKICAYMEFYYFASMILASLSVPFVIFILCKYWVFKKNAD